jgi:2-polyprenyl-3-methyl-5-hydroxy-6-metoxy-1,4-benzoquinol methylase
MTTSELYKKLLRDKHQEKGWGSSSDIPDLARMCIEEFNVKSIVDFGCGKGLVTARLQEEYPSISISGYDPSTDSTLPNKVDMVFSKDVLEHIEPELLEAVLSDLHRRTDKVQYHLIACHKAIHYLPDGRNTHLIIETPDWWQRKLRSLGFRIVNEAIEGTIKTPKGRESIATTKYHCVIDCR